MTPGFTPYSYIKNILSLQYKNKVKFKPLKANPIDIFWSLDRNISPNSDINVHPLKYAGISSNKKIKNLCMYLKKLNTEAYIINQPDSLAWLLNIRGLGP